MATMEYERSDANSQSSDEADKTGQNRALETLIKLHDHGMIQFSDDEFPGDDQEGESSRGEEPIHWSELPQNTWLRIVHQRDVNTEKGVVKILNLLHRDGATYKAWSTIIISDAIDHSRRNREVEFENSTPPHAELYVKSLGKKASKKHPSRSYYNFQLMHF